MAAEVERRDWLTTREKGSVLGIRVLIGVMLLFGRAAGRALLAIVIFYYVLGDGRLRRASREFLERVGRPHGFWDVYRHVLRFGQCILDRVYFLEGRFELFDVEHFGHDLLIDQLNSGRGAILVGAHMGSFEAMRAIATDYRVPITMVVNYGNARMINAVLDSFDVNDSVRLIQIGDGGVEFMLGIRERVEAGELVGFLGDRVPEGHRHAVVPFLGGEAPFPTGPYLVASALKCPVYLTFGLYRGGRRYELYAEELAARVELSRPRDAAVRPYVERYAERLEHYARMVPDNWFNFFDFWSRS